VGRADLLQLAYAGLTAPRHVAVFAVAAATLIPCWPRPAGASLALSPTSEGRPIGRSLEIAALGLDEGARLVAVVSTRALTGPQAESAARASLGGRAPDDDGVAVLTSALIVEP